MLKRMDGTLFDWLSWSGGGLRPLGVHNRYDLITANAHTIRKYAIGYCKSEHVLCRPKIGEMAVMFSKSDVWFWTHINKKEFDYLFPTGKEMFE